MIDRDGRRSGIACLVILALWGLGGDLAARTWRVLSVDNVEIVSNLPQRDLRWIHREIFYFHRTLEALFGEEFVQQSAPLHALIVNSEQEMKDFIGARGAHVSGIFLPRPGFEMFLARRGTPGSTRRTLFHELTHRNLNPLNPPLWLNEGIAELFETIDVGMNKVQVGKPIPDWVRFINASDPRQPLDFDRFFRTHAGSGHYVDSGKAAAFYAVAWLLAHYCWFGEPTLKDSYLRLSERLHANEDAVREEFGFDYAELESRLRSYALRGRFGYFEAQLNNLPSLPKADLQVASPELWKNFHARAYLLGGDHGKAHAFAEQTPPGDPSRLMAVETMAIVNFDVGLSSAAVRYLQEARELGTQNTLLRTILVAEDLEHHLAQWEGKGPRLSAATASKLMQDLLPALRLHRKHHAAAELAITIYDRAEANPSASMLELFTIWESDRGRFAPDVSAALHRIRERREAAAAITGGEDAATNE